MVQPPFLLVKFTILSIFDGSTTIFGEIPHFGPFLERSDLLFTSQDWRFGTGLAGGSTNSIVSVRRQTETFFSARETWGFQLEKWWYFCRIWSVFLIFGFKATGFHGLKHDQQNGWFFQIPHWNPCYHGIWSIHLMNLAKCLAAFGVANFPPGWDALFKALNWWMPWGFQDVPSHKNGSLRCTDVASTSINHLTNHFNLEKNRPKRRCTQFS